MSDKYTIEVEKKGILWFAETEGVKGNGHTMWQALSMLCGKIRDQEEKEKKDDVK